MQLNTPSDPEIRAVLQAILRAQLANAAARAAFRRVR